MSKITACSIKYVQNFQHFISMMVILQMVNEMSLAEYVREANCECYP